MYLILLTEISFKISINVVCCKHYWKSCDYMLSLVHLSHLKYTKGGGDFFLKVYIQLNTWLIV